MKLETMMRKLDDMARDIALMRDGNECIICKLIGKTAKSPLQPMHIISRSYKAIRWDLDNIITGCANHHGYGVHSNKTLTEDLLAALIAVMYPDRWEMINELKRTPFDLSMPTLLKIKNNLIKQGREYEAP